MRRSRSILALAVLAFLTWAGAARAAKTTRETITWQGKERRYYLFVPDSVKPPAPVTLGKLPLLLAFHGSGRDGKSILSTWEKIAKKEGFIVVAPDAVDQFFPIASVRATRDVLAERGFPVELTEIPNHDHWYYDIAPRINRQAWEFLAKHALSEDPRFEVHRYSQ
jgi:poly(3-hydroxybutyrate) depolymerase